MRFKMNFNLENENLPIQYRKNILSFIKLSLEYYNKEYFEMLYGEKNRIKPYTFAIFFKNPKFDKDNIIVEDKKLEVNMSIQDYDIGIILYNSFNHQKKKNFSIDRNSISLESISLIPEKNINSESINIKFMSPLVVRNRNQETKKDYYYSYKNENFKEQLKINIKEQLKITDISTKLVDSFDIEAINPKKTVIKFYEKQIESSIGTFKLTGDKILLQYLYQSGMRK